MTKVSKELALNFVVEGLRVGPEVFQDFDVSKPSAWIQHVPFMAWCVRMLEPRSYVELGTHWGVSFFAAVQTAKLLNMPFAARAIDFWEGDHQAGEYGEEVFAHVTERAKKFPGVTLTRSLFSDARNLVPDKSVDLLHIDGLHTYDAVKEDFDTWLSCVSDRGIILFHDVRETKLDFGVHQLWAELEEKYDSFTFDHGHGLGVLLVGPKVPKAFRQLAEMDKTVAGENVRRIFSTLGAALDLDPALYRQSIHFEGIVSHLEDRVSQLEDVAQEFDRLTQTVSWRVTKPLRWVRGLLNRL
jgi:hypothetical protein